MGLFNFIDKWSRPTQSSASHLIKAQNQAKALVNDISDIGHNLISFGANGVKVGASILGGTLAFEYFAGKAMLAYVGSSTINLFGSSTLGALVKQGAGVFINGVLKYPVISLTSAIATNMALHPTDVKEFVKNSYNLLSGTVKTVVDAAQFTYELGQVGYTKLWEQFEPSIKNLKSMELVKLLEETEEKNIEMKVFRAYEALDMYEKDITEKDETTTVSKEVFVKQDSEVQTEAKSENTISLWSSLTSAVSYAAPKVTSALSSLTGFFKTSEKQVEQVIKEERSENINLFQISDNFEIEVIEGKDSIFEKNELQYNNTSEGYVQVRVGEDPLNEVDTLGVDVLNEKQDIEYN